MKMLCCFVLSISLLLSISFSCRASIEIGIGNIIVDCSALSDSSIENLTATLFYSNLFDDPLTTNEITLDFLDNKLIGDIPMELSHTVAVLRLDNNISGCIAMGYLDVFQDNAITIQLSEDYNGISITDVSPKTEINSLWLTNRIGVHSNLVSEISTAYCDFLYFPCQNRWGSLDISESDFDHWENMSTRQKMLFDYMYDETLSGISAPISIQKFIQNNLYMGFISKYNIAYKKKAKDWYDKTVIEYPYEYYSFLSIVDLSENTFFRAFPLSYTPYYFSYQLLDKFPELNIYDGETITSWRHRIMHKLKCIHIQNDSLFNDFLLASSFIKNIRNGCPLTEFHKSQMQDYNINGALYTIILKENDELLNSTEKSYFNVDLTSFNSFDLKAYIEESNLNKAIVVDFWNTWCGPCLDSHKKLKQLQLSNPSAFENVEILYVSDDSSNNDNWERISKRMGGHHIRLSISAMQKLMVEYGFNAIPTYLFFDRGYNLIHTETAFPEKDKFAELLNTINN